MTKEFNLLPPTMPNFISIGQPIGQRQDGIKSFTVNVSDLTIEEAQEYGELMKQTFIKHHKNKIINQENK